MKALLIFIALITPCATIGEGAFSGDSLHGLLDGLGRMFKTVEAEEIETSRMMGRWFQMYKAAINFDVFRTQMFCPVSYFTANPVMGDSGFTIQEAFRVISKTGPIEVYKRDVTEINNGSYMMYTEEYFYPSQFVIIGAGPRFADESEKNEMSSKPEDASTESNETTATPTTTTTPEALTPYEYLIATDPNRLRLEIYSRDPVTFMQKYNKEVLTFIQGKGFGGGAFWNAPQPIYQGPDCEYPNEKEVFARRVLRNQQQAQQRAAQAAANGGRIDQGSLATSLFGGLNPQGVVNTFQGLFGTPGQTQGLASQGTAGFPQPAFPTQGNPQFSPPAAPQRINFGGQQQSSVFSNQ